MIVKVQERILLKRYWRVDRKGEREREKRRREEAGRR